MKKIQTLIENDFFLATILSAFIVSQFFALKITAIGISLLGIIGITLLLYNKFYKKTKLQKLQPIVYCWLVVYLVRVVWLFFSNSRSDGFLWLDRCLPMLLFPLILQYYPLNEKIIKFVLTFFVRFCLAFCLITIGIIIYNIITFPVSVSAWLNTPKSFYPLAFSWSNYDHPSYLCIIYLLSLPVGLYLNRHYRNITFIELAILFIAETIVIIFTGARIGFIIIPTLLFIMIIYIMPQRKLKIISFITMITIALIGTVVLFTFKNSFLDTFKDSERSCLREIAISSIKENPLIGVGTGGMKSIFDKANVAGDLIINPHNQYLGEIMQFGIIGAIPLFVTLIYLFIIALQRKDFLLLSFLLVLMIIMLTEMPFDTGKGLPFALFFSSLFLVISQNNKNVSKIQIT
ncbi:MAG: O-antigen ligase family protein [Bacteroidales bacterium]|jgi:O-antigen ligase|nr:O-antigen ligase family protein [Bacteroidales bacterium]